MRVDSRQIGKTTSPNVCWATPGDAGMPCKSCGSVNQKKFSAEMGIHFPKLKYDIDQPVVWVFPERVARFDDEEDFLA